MEKPHKKLRAWQLGMEIAVDIYKITDGFPSEEKYGLTSQLRRCGISIPSNVAEGAARNTKKEFIRFLYISSGSLSELDTQIELANRLGLIDKVTWKKLENKLVEEDKVLSGLIKSQQKLL